jgi:hypothetical protein
MKTIIVLASLFVAQMSLACLQQEAQFIGHVKNFQSEKVGQKVTCSYEIEYKMFNSSYVCPLWIGEVSDLRFADETCQKQNGEQVSGVLVKKDDVVVIE